MQRNVREMLEKQRSLTREKEERNLEWRCLTCKATEAPTGKGYMNLLKHSCDNRKVRLVDTDTGEELATNIKQAIAKGLVAGKGGAKKPQGPLTGGRLLSEGVEGDEHIKEQFQGYSKDTESYVFVMHADGRIRDLRLEQPLLYPVYDMMKRTQGYRGDFPQFLADAVETLFANAGYELTLAPKTQSVIYDEVVKLLQEGKLQLEYEGEELRLEVNNGHQDERSEGQPSSEVEPGGEVARAGPREEDAGESEQ